MQLAESSACKQSNRLFAALPQADWSRWVPSLEWVDLTVGQVLFQHPFVEHNNFGLSP
jgi:hypothetical protein